MWRRTPQNALWCLRGMHDGQVTEGQPARPAGTSSGGRRPPWTSQEKAFALLEDISRSADSGQN